MENTREARAGESEEPSGQDKPPHPWEEVPLAQWNDWRWQMSHRLNTVEQLSEVIHLTSEEEIGLSAPGRFRVQITPYFASLMPSNDPACPIRRQIVPTDREVVPFQAEMIDSLSVGWEEAARRAGRVRHHPPATHAYAMDAHEGRTIPSRGRPSRACRSRLASASPRPDCQSPGEPGSDSL